MRWLFWLFWLFLYLSLCKMAFSSLYTLYTLAFCQKSHVRLTLSTQWLFWLLPGFFLEEKAREKAVPIHRVLPYTEYFGPRHHTIYTTRRTVNFFLKIPCGATREGIKFPRTPTSIRFHGFRHAHTPLPPRGAPETAYACD